MDTTTVLDDLQTFFTSMSTSFRHSLASWTGLTITPLHLAICLSTILVPLIVYGQWTYALVFGLSVLIFHKHHQLKAAGDEIVILNDKLLQADRVAIDAKAGYDLEHRKSSRLLEENAQQATEHFLVQSQSEEVISQFRRELDIKDQAFKKLIVDNSKLAATITNLQSALAEQHSQLQSITAQCQRSSAESLERSQQLRAATESGASLSNRLLSIEQNLEATRAQLRYKNDELQARNLDFTSKSDALTKRNDKLFGQLTSALDDITSLKQKLVKADQAHAAQLQHVHDELAKAVKTNDGTVSSLKSDCTRLRGERDQHRTAFAKLRGDYARLRTDCAQAHADCTRLLEQQQRDAQEMETLRAAKEARQCNICMEEGADCVFTGCGHVTCCMACYQRIEVERGHTQRRCPMCRVRGPAKKAYFS